MTVISMIVAAAVPRRDVVALEQVVHDELGRHLGGDARAAEGHGDDEVVELHDARREQHGRGDDHGPEQRQHDRQVVAPGRERRRSRAAFHRSSSTPRRPASRIAMVRPGPVPQPRDDDGVDRHVLVDEPVEGEALEAHVAHELLQPEAGIEEPLPGHAR